MIHLIVLTTGCLFFGFFLAYAIWINVRTVSLRADLQLIRKELDQIMLSKGLTHDKNYITLRTIIHESIENAEYFSVPILWLSFRHGRSRNKPIAAVAPSVPDSMIKKWTDFFEAEGSPDEVKEATTRVILRLFLQLALTPSMIFVGTFLSISGRTDNLSRQLVALRKDPRVIETFAASLH